MYDNVRTVAQTPLNHISSIYFENPVYKIKRPQLSKLEKGMEGCRGEGTPWYCWATANKTKD